MDGGGRTGDWKEWGEEGPSQLHQEFDLRLDGEAPDQGLLPFEVIDEAPTRRVHSELLCTQLLQLLEESGPLSPPSVTLPGESSLPTSSFSHLVSRCSVELQGGQKYRVVVSGGRRGVLEKRPL